MSSTTSPMPSTDAGSLPLPGESPPGAPSETGAGRRRGRSKPATIEVPAAAAVNLLSPWVREENKIRTLRLRFAAGAVALVVVLALAWTGLHLAIKGHQQDLSDQEASATVLRAQIADMAPLRAYTASIRGREQLLTTSMSSEVTFSRALAGLDDLLPKGTSIGTFNGTLTPSDDSGLVPTSGEASACPGPDPFGVTTVVACVELSGLAPSREAVSQLVLALAKSPLFVEPFISTTTTDDAKIVAFSGSIGLDPRLLSGRFADPDADPAEAAETAPAEETS